MTAAREHDGAGLRRQRIFGGHDAAGRHRHRSSLPAADLRANIVSVQTAFGHPSSGVIITPTVTILCQYRCTVAAVYDRRKVGAHRAPLQFCAFAADHLFWNLRRAYMHMWLTGSLQSL